MKAARFNERSLPAAEAAAVDFDSREVLRT